MAQERPGRTVPARHLVVAGGPEAQQVGRAVDGVILVEECLREGQVAQHRLHCAALGAAVAPTPHWSSAMGGGGQAPRACPPTTASASYHPVGLAIQSPVMNAFRGFPPIEGE